MLGPFSRKKVPPKFLMGTYWFLRSQLIVESLKTTWIGQYLDTSNHGKWKEIVFLELEKHGGSLIFKGNLNKTDSLKTFPVKNNFTKELLKFGLRSILKVL